MLDGTLDEIQRRYGEDTVRLRADGAREALAGLPAVRGVIDMGRYQEVRLAPGADPQELLAALAARVKVQLFEVARPSLHDVFVRIAGPEAVAATGAPAHGSPAGAPRMSKALTVARTEYLRAIRTKGFIVAC